MKAMNFLLIPVFAAMAVSCGNATKTSQSKQERATVVTDTMDADTMGTDTVMPITLVRATTDYTIVSAKRALFGETISEEEDKTYTVTLTWEAPGELERIEVVGFEPYRMPHAQFTTLTGITGTRSLDGKSLNFKGTYPVSESGKYAYVYPKRVFGVWYGDQVQTLEDVSFAANQVQGTEYDSRNDNPDHLHKVNWMYSDQVAAEDTVILKPLGAIVRFDLTFPKKVGGGTITLHSSGHPFLSGVYFGYHDEAATAIPHPDSYSGSQSLELFTMPKTNRLIGYMMVGAIEDFDGLQNVSLTLTAEVEYYPEKGKTLYIKKLGTTKPDANWEAGKGYNFVVRDTEWEHAISM
jgi:hypothetical protein